MEPLDSTNIHRHRIHHECPDQKNISAAQVQKILDSLISQLVDDIQALKNVTDVHTLSGRAIILPLNIFENMMMVRENLPFSETELLSLSLVAESIKVYQAMIGANFGSTDARDSEQALNVYIFTTLYDQLSADVFEEVVGQERPPLHTTLKRDLKEKGMSNEQINKGLKFASHIYPIVILMLNLHKDFYVPPNQNNWTSLVEKDTQQFAREYAHHFQKVFKDKENEFNSLSHVWQGLLFQTIPKIWKIRLERA